MRAKRPEREGCAEHGGVRIHYEIFGDGEHTLLFVPPWSIVHSRAYKAQVPYFSERFRVLTYDPRGNGRSDRPRENAAYAMDLMVDDALAVMDATSTEKAILYAYSMGGQYAATIAAYHPERVEALVCISPRVPVMLDSPTKAMADFERQFEAPEGWQKFNRAYWQKDYADFCDFFIREIYPEPHSTKQIEDALTWAAESDGATLARTMSGGFGEKYPVDAAMYERITCPALLIHGADDGIAPAAMSEKMAEMVNAELHIVPNAGHAAHGRYPAWANVTVRDFLDRELGTGRPAQRRRRGRERKALYLSSPIGLGHARRDLAITRELRRLHPDLKIEWLAQDPVTRFLNANQECIHPASARLASESQHIEEEAGEHDLNAFQAIRDMDEVLAHNFMMFQEAVESDSYDLVIADEAWDVDHYWHEHPELKKAPLAWFTDFVGWVPMPGGGRREAALTADYNAEMIGHIESHPGLRDRAIFVGNPEDIVPLDFGPDLPRMREWIPRHFGFSGYVLGEHPSRFGDRDELRHRLGYRDDEVSAIVSVGGSGVGAPLIRRILAAYPIARRHIPNLRMTVVVGPRLDPRLFDAPKGVEVRAFVPDLDRHFAACDLALVQGGLTTCMELAAAGTPFLYFPLRNHFEQNVHVAHRLGAYGAGRRMIYDESEPDRIAEAMVSELRTPGRPRPVEQDGAARAAAMLGDLL